MSFETNEVQITKKDLRSVFFQSMPAEWLWNSERQMNVGYCKGMLPVLQKLYPDKKELREAMKRHLELFNVTPAILTFVLGISIAMEEQRAKDPEHFDTKSINAVKTALMGPLSGIGDGFYLGTLRVIAAGIGLSLALNGSILGPIAYLLVYNIPHYIIRYKATGFGYKLGTDAIAQLSGTGAMRTWMEAAGIVGLMVIGAMTAEMMFANITIPIGVGEAVQTVSEIIDGIVPGVVPLIFVGLINFLFNKKISPVMAMLLCLIIGLIGAFTGIMG
ncbi:MAG: PTS system mannose/fructose/sorbose family transporter subunit IID [Lachnospiraceae bacterium]|jgi:fructoselysine and glucoselysine-specific PTS system IID component|nr:PTS system mannose/fructose/sorbose family transporter subunit IID [Lachnospiraceae bacterium]MCI9622625.1 PTS system mannose/fructose/sorbose family transporter subunit IID [Lachnospiraceae bacterium]